MRGAASDTKRQEGATKTMVLYTVAAPGPEESPQLSPQDTHLPNLSLLLKSAPLLNSKLRHSTFLREGGELDTDQERKLLRAADETATLLTSRG